MPASSLSFLCSRHSLKPCNESETKQKLNNWGACYNDGSPECLERSPWLFISSHKWLTTHLSIKVSPCIYLCHCSAIFWSVFMIKCCLKDPNSHSHTAILTPNAMPWKLLLFCTNSRASFQVVRYIWLNTDQTIWLPHCQNAQSFVLHRKRWYESCTMIFSYSQTIIINLPINNSFLEGIATSSGRCSHNNRETKLQL